MSTSAIPSASQSALPPVLIVVLSEIIGAALLWALLTAESTPLVLALFAVMGGAFALIQLRPAIEETIISAFRSSRQLAMALGIVIVLAYPFFLGNNTYALHLVIVALLYSVLALALNFQLGSANIPNFATGATYGIGAYTSALLAINFGLSLWATLPAAALVATAFGFLLGIPSMRARDSYLALVTIAFGIVIHQMLNNLSWTGGPNGLVGIPAPSLFGHSFMQPIVVFGFRLPSQANFYYLAASLLGLAILSAKRLHESRIGLAWNAIRADELAARCQGINVAWYKILAFAVDAFLAAFAGTIYAFYVSYISPDNFTFLVSVTIMTMVIVGGMDNTFGVIVGAFLLTLLPEKLRIFSDYRLLFVSVVVILFLVLRPKGLFPQRPRHYGAHS
ncbi:UNVERIFIED_ORG: branched-chain amino acid ABC transporter permease (plasmid) [Roseateles sp. XES5]|nr:branched-chain amino acid ABC transporter permease [Roseateles sp. XES5]